MSTKAYASIATAFKVEWDGKYCSQSCPQMEDGLCTKFSGTLQEQNLAKDLPEKLRWEACIDAVALFQHVALTSW